MQWRRERGNEVVRATMKEWRKKDIKMRMKEKMESRGEGGKKAVNKRRKQYESEIQAVKEKMSAGGNEGEKK